MTRILITGASGLLGGRLAQHFQTNSHFKVRCTSRTPRPGFIQLDLADEVQRAGACAGIDWVIHAAGMNAGACASDPVAARAVNGDLTGDLARSAAISGAQGMVFLSTAHVYDSPLRGHLREDSPPRNTHPYATSNLLGERRLTDVAAETGLTPLILRLSNGFGAPVSPQADCWMLVLNEIARQIATTGRAKLRSSGEQLRDFVPISHICSAIERLLVQKTEGVFTLSSGLAQPVIDVVEQLVCIVERDLDCHVPLETASPSGDAQPELLLDPSALAAHGVAPPDDESFMSELTRLWRFCKTHAQALS